ncbi:PABIR family member 2 isoform X8 [Phyllopteryx taeniolatus]|uniref:PABIR family member 2 isoform X8 n=1 Tax=Phyllopteryx taeniolatus TaxID=161469 RepID=UPI002AD2551E|nr:PABIR family member 2 isoform X8 [Phyllopteryx taeniolatus]
MERMEVDQCAGAAAGALRRSISAPMITSVSERMAECSPVSWLRQRRVSVNCSCPSQEDKMEASLQGTATHRLRCRRLACSAHFEATRPHTSSLLSRVSSQLPAPPGSQCHQNPPEWFRSPESGVTPNSSPSPTRRFRPVGGANIRCPALTPLKRKGGAESDGPPKKLFVTAVLDPSHHSSYTLRVRKRDVQRSDRPPAGRRGSTLSPFAFCTRQTEHFVNNLLVMTQMEHLVHNHVKKQKQIRFCPHLPSSAS